MIDFVQYVVKGCLHYINLLFEMFDYKEYGFIFLIIAVIFICSIINKEVRKSVIGLVKPFFNIIKTVPGFIFLILFVIYYLYIIVYFEEKINLLIMLMFIYLLIDTFVKTNLNLLAESKKSIFKTILDFSVPVILLCLQQITLMMEVNCFDNINYILYSLIVIPIFSILFIILKNYVNFDGFFKSNKKNIKIDEYEFYKLFNYSLMICFNYRTNELLLNQFLNENSDLNYKEMKAKIKSIFPKVIKYQRLENKKAKKTKFKTKKTKLFKFFNYVWIINIISLFIYVFNLRFNNLNFDFWYYFSFDIVILYFWYDLMRIKKIENQFDFVIYMAIYIAFIIILILYSKSLIQFRLTEIGFLLPILIFIRIVTFNKESINFLQLPFLSTNNFFGLTPSNYKNINK